ncbi:Vps72/YL1, C-terminal [Dillenia turbinata]|uniref:Vps72/YL1, C-terminal n=1 Tax=Dillenia turbinata TaxID=194707 RepID=A0AAN8V9U1_9MAGN
METSKEEPIFLNRASRVTRGKRMTKLLVEEIEEDELFWNQDALKEEENDVNYEEEAEVADEFDSDFDEDEPEPEEEVQNDVDDRIRTKKRLIFPGKTLSKKKKKKKDLSKLEEDSKDEKTAEHSNLPEPQDVPDDMEGERTVRKSTRTSVIVRQAERDAIRAALQATMKPIKRKKEGEEKRMTQEEMLLEAAQTEILNLRNLERVLAREEEVKKRAVVHKAVYNGPLIRYSSKNGCSYLEFVNEASFQSEISTTPAPYHCEITLVVFSVGSGKILALAVNFTCVLSFSDPQKDVCVVTSLPAKYRDPKTGLPYATKEAFRNIRERFSDDNNKEKGRGDMGDLFGSISGQGFLVKRKRSVIPKKLETSYFRYLARFRRIPALENQTSE